MTTTRPRLLAAASTIAALVLAAGCTTAPTQTPPASGPSAAPTAAAPGQPITSLSLERIPWEGGPAYYKKFAKADAAGWSDPSFFPVLIWYNGISSDAEAQYDKKMGFNTYVGMDKGTDYGLFQRNGLFWIGEKLNDSFNAQSTNWVGDFLEDEADGRFEPKPGLAQMAKRKAETGKEGRFRYSNFTQLIMNRDFPTGVAEDYVNNYSDVVSMDMYFYTVPYCSQAGYNPAQYPANTGQKYCRTASSYGRTVDALRLRDAADGKLLPLWNFVEIYNGMGSGNDDLKVTPEQATGAAMSSIIHEARGLAWFNQSFTGQCKGTSLVREVQMNPNHCAAANVNAVGAFNNQVHRLAPVINTQSYKYKFGDGLDTMLKVHDGSAYVFAMVDNASDPGQRTFQVPDELKGRTVEVVDENRTIPMNGDGTFTDNFAQESSYHIYRIH